LTLSPSSIPSWSPLDPPFTKEEELGYKVKRESKGEKERPREKEKGEREREEERHSQIPPLRGWRGIMVSPNLLSLSVSLSLSSLREHKKFQFGPCFLSSPSLSPCMRERRWRRSRLRQRSSTSSMECPL